MAILVVTYDNTTGGFKVQKLGSAQIGDGVIVSAKIGPLAVAAPHIAANAIVSGKVASGGLSPLTSGKIWAGFTGNIPREENKPAAGWTPTGDGGTKVAADDIETSAGIPLTKLEAAVCSETEAAVLIDAALLNYSIEATLADFQANAATGTFTQYPERANDNNPATNGNANTIGQYAEIEFGKWIKIDQWRIYGAAGNNEDGVWKIEYFGLDLAWHDWKTGIPTNLAAWTSMSAETEVACRRVRLTVTTVDTAGLSFLGELEVYHS